MSIIRVLVWQDFDPQSVEYNKFWYFWALCTFAGRISSKQEAPDVAVFDKGIASAIFEEKNATDGCLAAGRKLTEKVNEAQNGALPSSTSSIRQAGGPPQTWFVESLLLLVVEFFQQVVDLIEPHFSLQLSARCIEEENGRHRPNFIVRADFGKTVDVHFHELDFSCQLTR